MKKNLHAGKLQKKKFKNKNKIFWKKNYKKRYLKKPPKKKAISLINKTDLFEAFLKTTLLYNKNRCKDLTKFLRFKLIQKNKKTNKFFLNPKSQIKRNYIKE